MPRIEWLTVGEAARYARRHPKTISNALRAGDLHGKQRGVKGTWSVEPECVDAWLGGEKCPHQAQVKAARRGRAA